MALLFLLLSYVKDSESFKSLHLCMFVSNHKIYSFIFVIKTGMGVVRVIFKKSEVQIYHLWRYSGIYTF